MRMVVDLPAPLLPRKPKISPGPTLNDTWSTATNVAEAPGEVADDDRVGDGAGGPACLPSQCPVRAAPRRAARWRAPACGRAPPAAAPPARRARRCSWRRRRAKRSPTTRRASVARRGPHRRPASIAARRRLEVEPPLAHLERRARVSNSASALADRRARRAAASATSACDAAAVPERPAHVHARVPRLAATPLAREDARVGPRVVDAARHDREYGRLLARAPRRARSPAPCDARFERLTVGPGLRAPRPEPASAGRCRRGGGSSARPPDRSGASGGEPDEPAQVRRRHARACCAPRCSSICWRDRCASTDEHVVRRDEADLQAVAHVAQRARPSARATRPATRTVSPAVTSAQKARVTSSRRSLRAAARSCPVALRLGARGALERVGAPERCRSATGGRGVSGSCRGCPGR